PTCRFALGAKPQTAYAHHTQHCLQCLAVTPSTRRIPRWTSAEPVFILCKTTYLSTHLEDFLMRNSIFVGLALLAAVLVMLPHARGKTATQDTLISIEDLDCPTCAKGVEKALTAVAGVAGVKTDIEKEMATVTPEANKTLSPRALWEAVEKAGFKPLKLEG